MNYAHQDRPCLVALLVVALTLAWPVALASAKINVSSLSAISGNIGTITAGTISGITITGVTITGTTSISGAAISGGSLNIGSGNFTVSSGGLMISTNAALNGINTFGSLNGGAVLANGILNATGAVTFGNYGGSGNRTLCVNNGGALYTVASGAAC